MRTLNGTEQETIINFNKGEAMANIFTYEDSWKKHLEEKLGLKPLYDNGYGGREYEIPKNRIKPPRAPKNLSPEQRKRVAERLAGTRMRAVK